MVVPGNHQHAAMRRGAIGVAVLQRITGAIQPRALSVPQAEDAFELLVRIGLHLLRAEHGGRGQILVDRWQELDAVFRNQLLRPPQLQVDATKRRAAIAGDETRGVQPGGLVSPRLVEHDAHQRLRAGHEHAAIFFHIAVFKPVFESAAATLPLPMGSLQKS